MIKIKEAIIVEGTYDKIKLSSFVDGIIYVTGGFSFMHNDECIATIKTLADTTGIVVFTDSDSAGFRIRNFIKDKVKSGVVKHAYIPECAGKEKRKRVPGAEGLLGVEGMTKEIILKALFEAGCEIDGEQKKGKSTITKSDLYFLGLSGGDNSKEKREKLMNHFGLPSKISANMMCEVLSRLTTVEEIKRIIDII